MCSILGYPAIGTIYKKALIHKSINENYHNERLEFLGDAILSFLIAEMLFVNNKNQEEGFLSQQRAKIVSRKHLNLVGKSIIPENQIQSRLKKLPINIYGNTLEAIIGAIYIDKGIVEARKFIKKYVYKSSFLKQISDLDFKALLSKQALKENGSIEYIKDELDCTNSFSVSLIYNGKRIAKSIANTKKEAEQKAAKKAIKILF